MAGLHKRPLQTPAVGVFCGDAQLIDDSILFVWSWGNEIHIWNSEKCELSQTLYSHEPKGLGILQDGLKVFDVCEDYAVTKSLCGHGSL